MTCSCARYATTPTSARSQNDIHRVGQKAKAKLKVYRLITRNTYENKMFDHRNHHQNGPATRSARPQKGTADPKMLASGGRFSRATIRSSSRSSRQAAEIRIEVNRPSFGVAGSLLWLFPGFPISSKDRARVNGRRPKA
jgi:hypothetical protein